MDLLAPGAEVGFLGSAAMPAELYFVCRSPVALAGMAYPSRIDWSLLAAEGVQHVVCLTHDDPPYDASPLAVHGIALQDLFARHGPPDDPERERARVLRAAGIVVAGAQRGEGSAVHCRGGRGRAGTVLGVALVQLGHDPKRVVSYLDQLHRARSKDGWPEHPWQADTVLKCVV
ncbi:MAG TPA: hypothetical protein VGO03_11055, partial [Acidimicrobiia bacterium]